MTKSGIAARPSTTAEAPPPPPVKAGTTTVIAVVGLVWLAITLAVARGSLPGDAGDIAVSTAVLSLPALVQAALFAGVSAGFAVTLSMTRVRPRLLTGLATGAGVGALAFGTVVLGYGMASGAETAVGASVCLAALLGGALSALRPARMISAGLLATFPVLLIGYLMGHFTEELLRLFGSTGTVATRYSASGYFGMTQALLQGLAAGIVAFLLLRRGPLDSPGGKSRPAALVFGFAGALPGLIIGIAEIFTRVAAPRLLATASEVSRFDQLVYNVGNGNRTNQALVVFFIGALTALIAYGRTVGKKPTPPA
ncbi:MAG: hypothetical protein HOV79_28220 [Hamadaea sp.]|nr:hypothetical protein [Hamadaea sp.]